jgi:hypothetical protein
MNKNILYYTAGLFDGEGCVDIYNATPAKASKNISLMLRVNIVQKDGQIMNFLQEHFGGYVGVDRHHGHYIHHWEVRSKQAKVFLSLIYPFTIIKKEQIKTALEFETMKGRYWDSLKGHQGFRKLTPDEIKKRLEYKERLSKMKRQYTPYMKNGINFTATETKRRNILR